MKAPKHPRYEPGVLAHVPVEPAPARRRVLEELQKLEQKEIGVETGPLKS